MELGWKPSLSRWICRSLPMPAVSTLQFLGCWGAQLPAMAGEKGQETFPALPCHWQALVSTDHHLMPVCASPRACGSAALLPFPHPFSRVVPAFLCFPWQEQTNNLCCSPHSPTFAEAGWAARGTGSLKPWRPASWLPPGL